MRGPQDIERRVAVHRAAFAPSRMTVEKYELLSHQDHYAWAIFMVVYGVAVISSVDNFLKPILMSRAGHLSMLLVVLGVFGGALAFGFIGLFVGPALLAVGWSLAKAWLEPPPIAGTSTP